MDSGAAQAEVPVGFIEEQKINSGSDGLTAGAIVFTKSALTSALRSEVPYYCVASRSNMKQTRHTFPERAPILPLM